MLLDPDIFLATLSQALEIKIIFSKLETAFHSNTKTNDKPIVLPYIQRFGR